MDWYGYGYWLSSKIVDQWMRKRGKESRCSWVKEEYK